jgi:hypothetical protein
LVKYATIFAGFMDTQLVEHALSMPPSLKMAEKGKHPLKYIARGDHVFVQIRCISPSGFRGEYF